MSHRNLSSAQFEDPDAWSFDVFSATHDQVKEGNHAAVHRRVVLSKQEFPTYNEASLTAAHIAAKDGSMPTDVRVRI